MSQSPSTDQEQPHIVSLVLHAKKALQQGQHLCTRASEVSSSSAQVTVDVLALDAQVRWMSGAVLDQLKLAAQVAKSIEQKRSELERQVEEWDGIRNQRSDALDTILETLSTQFVPPEYHSVSADSSPFGSQHGSDDEGDRDRHTDENSPFGPPRLSPGTRLSPTDTIRNRSPLARRAERNSRHTDRSRWKSLRDFVDEGAIEDMLDTIEKDRQELDDILATTADYPESLLKTIDTIRGTVPVDVPLPSFRDIFKSQEKTSSKMAEQLESLVHHYNNMDNAFHDFEAGEEFSEEDMQGMNGDADALPVIVGELEGSLRSIEVYHEQLLDAKATSEGHLEGHRNTLSDLDELGDIMSEMLERQQAVENESIDRLSYMHAQLQQIESLHHKYTSYQYSYSKLVLELADRQQYREEIQRRVSEMAAELDARVEEERLRRANFQTEHGPYIPEDFGLYIENPPNRWNVCTTNNEHLEPLPVIDSGQVQAAKRRIAEIEAVAAAARVVTSQSL
ncbi:autophagy protein Apg17-domain-containing protein [Epithele typhae]|uniref:autophagy protein Apg17-domain-containing protein n=1 Tax=Epithele typhae TaxID=378194 RepID=UPI0020074327|nr:autophagy protein Apg17-domain-containing protein [Epithele typhae]KAH9945266.1 autophagy protein Apg17-domain-containing protein [Epithele typhae]